MKKTKVCEICGKVYTPQSQCFETSKTCSRSCHSKRMNAIQTEKGTRFTRDYSFMKGNQNRKGHAPARPFDKFGEDHPGWKPSLKFTCKNCGNEFERKPWQTRGKGRTTEYCSAACRSEYRAKFLSSENAPDYVGGPQTYRGKSWLTARRKVVEKQAGCCDSCGKHVGKSLPVHHIRPFREFKTAEEANTLSNLVGLCQSCHMKLEPRPKKKV